MKRDLCQAPRVSLAVNERHFLGLTSKSPLVKRLFRASQYGGADPNQWVRRSLGWKPFFYALIQRTSRDR